ncbi:uncharacterized protein LOC142473266 isoform X2 [Ascaphus truei]|uniref:uncharacterized protein LOC142473266 isoform X2 n=1 Tax=Ascaphus truei TaxID=8439 RepID=UPI003F5915F8
MCPGGGSATSWWLPVLSCLLFHLVQIDSVEQQAQPQVSSGSTGTETSHVTGGNEAVTSSYPWTTDGTSGSTGTETSHVTGGNEAVTSSYPWTTDGTSGSTGTETSHVTGGNEAVTSSYPWTTDGTSQFNTFPFTTESITVSDGSPGTERPQVTSGIEAETSSFPSGLDGTSGSTRTKRPQATSGIEAETSSFTSGIDGTSGSTRTERPQATSGIEAETSSLTSGIDGTFQFNMSSITAESRTDGSTRSEGSHVTSGMDALTPSLPWVTDGTSGSTRSEGSHVTSGMDAVTPSLPWVTDGTSGSTGTEGSHGTSGMDTVTSSLPWVTDGTSGSPGTEGSHITSGMDALTPSLPWVTDGTSGSPETEGSHGTSGMDAVTSSFPWVTDGTSGSPGTEGSHGTSGMDAVTSSFPWVTDGTSGSPGTEGSHGTSGMDAVTSILPWLTDGTSQINISGAPTEAVTETDGTWNVTSETSDAGTSSLPWVTDSTSQSNTSFITTEAIKDVIRCLDDGDCPPFSTCPDQQGRRVCRCDLGYYFQRDVGCVIARTFAARISLPERRWEQGSRGRLLEGKQPASTQEEKNQRKARSWAQLSEKVGTVFQSVLGNIDGYLSTSVPEQNPGEESVVILHYFSALYPVTAQHLQDALMLQHLLCTRGGPRCVTAAFIGDSYQSLSLCNFEMCDSSSSACLCQDGLVTCDCRPGYYKLHADDRSCRACDTGFQLKENRCLRCPFGFSGFNCDEPFLLTVVVESFISCVLLILFITLLIFYFRRKKPPARPTFLDSIVLGVPADQQVHRLPRAQFSGRNDWGWAEPTVNVHPERASTDHVLEPSDFQLKTFGESQKCGPSSSYQGSHNLVFISDE